MLALLFPRLYQKSITCAEVTILVVVRAIESKIFASVVGGAITATSGTFMAGCKRRRDRRMGTSAAAFGAGA